MNHKTSKQEQTAANTNDEAITINCDVCGCDVREEDIRVDQHDNCVCPACETKDVRVQRAADADERAYAAASKARTDERATAASAIAETTADEAIEGSSDTNRAMVTSRHRQATICHGQAVAAHLQADTSLPMDPNKAAAVAHQVAATAHLACIS